MRLGIRRGLRLTPLLALPAAGLLMLLAVHADSAYLAIALLAMCYGLVELTEGSFWAAAMTIGRRNTMAVGGVMNTGGSLGGVVGIPVVAYLSGHGAWNTAFFVGTGFAVLTAVTWLFIDASHVAAAPVSRGGTCPGRAWPIAECGARELLGAHARAVRIKQRRCDDRRLAPLAQDLDLEARRRRSPRPAPWERSPARASARRSARSPRR